MAVGLAQAQQFVKSILDWLDSNDLKRMDPEYVTLYGTHWRVGVGGVLYRNASTLGGYPTEGEVTGDIEGHFDSDDSPKLDLSLGYRALGISYSFDLEHDETNMLLSFNGDVVGGSVFYNRSSSLHGNVDVDVSFDYEGKHYDYDRTAEIDQSASLKRYIFADGYYVFNNRKYSHAAYLGQSSRQKKSAGSFLLGVAYTRSIFHVRNEIFNKLWFRLHQVDVSEGALGIGYSHNFVYQIGENHQILYAFNFMPSLALCKKIRAYYDDEETEDIHETKWIWENRHWEDFQFMWKIQNTLLYSYRQFFVGMNVTYQYAEMSNDEIKIRNEVFIPRAYAGFRF